MIRGFDGFRALACLSVFAFDIYDGFGYLGVPAFFVLSGFLMTSTLVRMNLSLEGRAYFTTFYGRRIVRIFPLYYAYLAVASIAVVATGDHEFKEMLPWAITYTINLRGAGNGYEDLQSLHYVDHLWSLSVEEQFYLVWPLLVHLVPAHRLKHTLIALIASGPLLRLLEYAAIHTLPLPWNDQWELIIYTLPFSHIDAFATGGFFALFASARFCNGKVILPAVIGVVAVGFATEYLDTGTVFWGALGYPSLMKDSYKFVWAYSLINVLVAMTLVAIRRRCLLPQLFEHGWLVYLGRISYGLYLFDRPIITFLQRHLTGSPRIMIALLAFSLAFVAASLSYHIFESPLLALKQRWFSSVRSALEPTSPT